MVKKAIDYLYFWKATLNTTTDEMPGLIFAGLINEFK